MDKFISAREAGKLWGVSGVTVAQWCADGRVPGAMKIKVSWLIPANTKLEDVERPKFGRPKSDNKKSH